MTGKVSDSGDSYIYTYNLQNRLQTATITRTEGTSLVDITSAYVYNQSGIRVGASTITKIDGGPSETKNTTYLVDPANFTGYAQILEESVNGTLAKTYSIAQEIIAQSSNGTTNYLMRDGHNNTRLLTDNASSISGRYHFDAYGKELGTKFGVTNTPATKMLYAGEQYDSGLQNYYNRARYYNPANGTWNRLDPFSGNLRDPQSLHKYSYCHQNPVMGMDPSGLGLVGAGLRRLIRALGADAAIRMMVGIVATNVIGSKYQIEHFGHLVDVNRQIARFADVPNIEDFVAEYALRPDIVDHTAKTVYEIKSFLSPGRIVSQVNLYIKTLTSFHGVLYSGGIWPKTPRTYTIAGIPGFTGLPSIEIEVWNQGPGMILYSTMGVERLVVLVESSIMIAEMSTKIPFIIQTTMETYTFISGYFATKGVV